jgi:purine-binding chemotaxis protein CheW
MSVGAGEDVLLVRSGAQVCALPLRHVLETMRPLPVTPIASVPPFVQGAAVVRGEPAPVVLLDVLLQGAPEPAGRFVSIRSAGRRALLAVAEVIGVGKLPATGGVPMLRGAAGGSVSALGALDRDLLAVLDAALLVPEEVWRAMPGGGAAP